MGLQSRTVTGETDRRPDKDRGLRAGSRPLPTKKDYGGGLLSASRRSTADNYIFAINRLSFLFDALIYLMNVKKRKNISSSMKSGRKSNLCKKGNSYYMNNGL